ncbi:hypothetical protein [Myxacorys almedinensis]|uniref:Uncharacterized protein n=1 Tax=Myxacorys almedinensis A TaxID=2690445 RepID=A0A8J7Z425_9CYAN|nr:hypothetical protein [Myxacorys almedinensis]NDJ19604.1 hypothetical protein [Myxacorys almedinensis A]
MAVLIYGRTSDRAIGSLGFFLITHGISDLFAATSATSGAPSRESSSFVGDLLRRLARRHPF